MTTILLSEDEPVLARNIMRALESSGIEVIHAKSAAMTRAALAARSFNLILADISLGDGDGIDVISQADIGDTPVIVMTGQDSLANRSRAENIPVAAFLAKPFALARMRELVEALTRSASAADRTARRGPSVVMYSHDTIGLGHMRRNSAIARALVDMVPCVSVLMLVGCPAGMIFEPHPGIDYVKLPSLTKIGRGDFQPGSLRLDTDTTRRLRMEMIEGVIRSFDPDIFLVDHEPAGVMGELEIVLERLRGRRNVKSVLGLRDILDDPEKVRQRWAENGTDRAIGACYDQVFVYGDERFFPSATAYGLNEIAPGRVSHCGIVTTSRRAAPRAAGRPKNILVSGGGGRDGYPLIDAVLSGVESLPQRRRPNLTVVTGPLMDRELHDDAEARCEVLGARIHAVLPDLTGLIAASDLMISMAGYNSVNEALALGCPVITIPRLGPTAEQRLRAEALAAHGLGRYLPREDMTPDRLAMLMTEPVNAPTAHSIDLGGATNAAARLAAMLTETTIQDRETLYAAK